MAIIALNPYLMFNGKAEEAIQLYQKALGATVEGPIMRFSEAPGEPPPGDYKNCVMHAQLRVGAAILMLSDGMPGTPVPSESNTYVTLSFDDVADMTSKFEALADGGEVVMPLQDTFWGATFGVLHDRFGIRWMFDCAKKT